MSDVFHQIVEDKGGMSRLKTLADGHTEIVAVPDSGASKETAIVGYSGATNASLAKEDEEDLEIKLRRIIEHVPVRVSNTSGSSAGSGSGDFHQYRQMRRREQDRLSRMDADYQRRKELAEFNARREERIKAAEERTAKKRAKRQKKKDKRKNKRNKLDVAVSGVLEEIQQDSADEESTDYDSSKEEKNRPQSTIQNESQTKGG